MTTETKTKKSWPRRVLWALAVLVILSLLAIVALRIFITTGSGARFIESQINKRSFGPIERVEISGLSGDPLDIFSIKSVKVYDVDGVWLTANDIDIDWNPWALRGRVLDLDSVIVSKSELVRRLKLNSTQSPSPSTDNPYSVQLESGRVGAFTLDGSFIGQQAVLSVSGGVTTQKSGAIDAKLSAVRIDAAGDALSLDFIRNRSGEMVGDFDLKGADGGTFATLLRVPKGTALSGTGQIRGDIETGQGDIVIAFNGAPKITAKGYWSKDQGGVQGNLNTTNWPLFDRSRRGLGDEVDITAFLSRTRSPEDFEVVVKSDRLTATARGQLNPEGGLHDSVKVTARSNSVGAILPLPDGYKLGAGDVDGTVNINPEYAFAGTVGLRDITTPYARAASLKGPVRLRQGGDAVYDIEGNLTLDNLTTTAEIPIKLSAKTQLTAKARLNSETTEIAGVTFSVTSGETTLRASGDANYTAPSFNISGDVAANITTMGAVPAGALQSDFRLQKTATSLLAFSADGGFKPAAALAPPFDSLLEGGVNFDVDMSPIEGGLQIAQAKLAGQNIRAALSGRVTETLNIEGEALLSAPLTYPPVSLSGETSASFTATGARTDPNLRLDARAGKTEVSGYVLQDARLRTEIKDIMNAPKGPLRLTANTEQGKLDISADFASREQVYIANDIVLTWGRLTATGDITKPVNAPAAGKISLNLPEKGDQFARADLTLFAQGQNQGISLNADGKNIAYKDFAFDKLSARAEGTLSSLEGQIQAEGQRKLNVLERQFSLNTPFSLSRADDGAYRGTLNPDAKYGNVVLDAGPPIQAEYNAGDITLIAPLSISGSNLDIRYSKLSGQEKFVLKTSELPISLIPMPGSLADTRGRIGADIQLATAPDGTGAAGGGRVTLTDWRGFDIDRETGLSGDMSFTFSGDRINWKLDASSSKGFTASGEGNLPISNAPSLAAIRPRMNAPVSGKFDASGEAAAILGLVTPSDANPSGQLKANLSLSGTAADPLVEGQASGSELSLEAPQLGTRLRKGRFTANFKNDTLEIKDVFVADNSKGTITGQGLFKLGEFGRPVGELNMKAAKFRALDRRDFEGTVTGNLGFTATQETGTLTGDITLNQAEVKQFVTGGATVVEIPVEEINKSDRLKPIEIKAPVTPISLDINLRAPRRIFVRSRGLDVELSVDASVKGTLTAPEVYGEANILRGGYKIAGKELAFETGGIKFDGELSKARVNLVANTNTQNLSATIEIKGTVAEPEIELSSSPDRPQDEILSALLFGRSATELSTIEAAQLAGALAQFSGAGGGFDLMGGLRDALGVGQLSIGLGEDGGAQITGGRYLAKNVYLQVFSGGGTGQTGAVIDWEVRKNISLRSKIQADNDQSFTLKWKRDFYSRPVLMLRTINGDCGAK